MADLVWNSYSSIVAIPRRQINSHVASTGFKCESPVQQLSGRLIAISGNWAAMVYVPSWTAQNPLTWTRRRSITFWARGTRLSHGGSERLFHVALAENTAPGAGYRNARWTR